MDALEANFSLCKTVFFVVSVWYCSHQCFQVQHRCACFSQSLYAIFVIGAYPTQDLLHANSFHFYRKTGLPHFWPVLLKTSFLVVYSNSLENSLNIKEKELTYFAALVTQSPWPGTISSHLASFIDSLIIISATPTTRSEGFTMFMLQRPHISRNLMAHWLLAM